MLIDKLKIPFYKSMIKWRMLLITSFKTDPIICNNCGSIMKFEYGFT